jgi:hypothetical protein
LLAKTLVWGLGLTFLVASAHCQTASVSFVRLDTVTQGNWTNVYGSDGFAIANDSYNAPPSYASFSVSASGGAGQYTWASSTSDPRAPQVSAGSGTRIASTWFTTSSQVMTVGLNDGNTHRVALYFLDWSNNGRSQDGHFCPTPRKGLIGAADYSGPSLSVSSKDRRQNSSF